ncbi:MAG: 30S ribosomal protein S2 [Candidatus Aenigmarchaeota archaeon]|nr:30S ribosomal protein S2 [Candidatus Aenigmarchaeota archaeon]
MKKSLLIPREQYLSAGVHIGMTSKTADMNKFIYKVRPNGLAVLNVGMLDSRIAAAANMLSNAKDILIVARKDVAQSPAKKFAEVIGARSVIGRFMPGSLTNPTYENFFEPEIILLTDPAIDKQALKEAVQIRIPIIALSDTFNNTDYLDLVVPCNNRGKKSIALVLWLIAKLIMEKRNEKFELKPEDFGYEEAEEKTEMRPRQQRPMMKGGRDNRDRRQRSNNRDRR